jgi:hypothetical protein
MAVDSDDDMDWEEAEDEEEGQGPREGDDEDATNEELEAALAAMREQSGLFDDDEMGGEIVVQLDAPEDAGNLPWVAPCQRCVFSLLFHMLKK